MCGDGCHQTKKRENGRLSGDLAGCFEFISLKPFNTSTCSWWNQVVESVQDANRNETGACIMKDQQGSLTTVLGDRHGRRDPLRTINFPQASPLHLER